MVSLTISSSSETPLTDSRMAFAWACMALRKSTFCADAALRCPTSPTKSEYASSSVRVPPLATF